ncbi:hypothetical protein DL95DRAFT_393001 [Leptodontidium sp. 2 PMI_412]|nr:hypothetical protein DL95DRAFT_393001 [Leptodontidium sp. 2 PMI_412]
MQSVPISIRRCRSVPRRCGCGSWSGSGSGRGMFFFFVMLTNEIRNMFYGEFLRNILQYSISNKASERASKFFLFLFCVSFFIRLRFQLAASAAAWLDWIG